MTIGGYGFSEDKFFSCLREYRVDTFVDVRQRRGMRGSKYAFLNSVRLQKRLENEGVKYLHAVELAPTTAVRETQKLSDRDSNVEKRDRKELSHQFIERYRADVLDKFDHSSLRSKLEGSDVIVLFCVEGPPAACHRSIAAERLAQLLHVSQSVGHLKP